MNRILRSTLAALMAVLLFLSTAWAANDDLTRLAGELLTLETQISAAEAANAEVERLEAEYARLEKNKNTSEKKLLEVQDQLLEAMLAAEETGANLDDLYNQRLDLNDELADLMDRNGCTVKELTAKGYASTLKITVTLDKNNVIYDLAVVVEGDEKDAAVADPLYLLTFVGKQLPLTTGKKGSVELLPDARKTSQALVDALNGLEGKQGNTSGKKETANKGPIIKPQDIADYIFEHGKLPDNFITKKQAQNLGWDSSRNYVSDVAPGKSIGGDRFGNYEGQLPDKKGRTWKEADCNYTRGKRGAERIVFSNDGLVYYTGDHYNTFTKMSPSGR